MIINTEKIQELLDNTNISSNQIMNITGFNRKNVWMYRTGKTKLMNMQLHTLIKLQKCYDQTHNTFMKYKNLQQVVDQFNGRHGQTEIYISPGNELKILYDGIIGDVKDDDIKVFSKSINYKLTVNKLTKHITSIID